ncbi:hypothetical protein B0T09DRAFT_336975 [Sordaria sp. MPI-SDFR-AT-0083]|nr:hypothetical protein B0T09DRAFT_336975 [Sordaria sp. MPI-SDFR-AT-0083]
MRAGPICDCRLGPIWLCFWIAGCGRVTLRTGKWKGKPRMNHGSCSIRLSAPQDCMTMRNAALQCGPHIAGMRAFAWL